MKQRYVLHVLLCSCVFFIVTYRHNAKIEDLEDAIINLSKPELSPIHTRTSKVSHNIHKVFGMLPMRDSN